MKSHPRERKERLPWQRLVLLNYYFRAKSHTEVSSLEQPPTLENTGGKRELARTVGLRMGAEPLLTELSRHVLKASCPRASLSKVSVSAKYKRFRLVDNVLV